MISGAQGTAERGWGGCQGCPTRSLVLLPPRSPTWSCLSLGCTEGQGQKAGLSPRMPLCHRVQVLGQGGAEHLLPRRLSACQGGFVLLSWGLGEMALRVFEHPGSSTQDSVGFQLCAGVRTDLGARMGLSLRGVASRCAGRTWLTRAGFVFCFNSRALSFRAVLGLQEGW